MKRQVARIGIVVLAWSAGACGDGKPLEPSRVTTPTPSPTPPVQTFRGVVHEPGAGPVEGVIVSAVGVSVGPSYTDANGAFELTGPVRDGLFFERTGYTSTFWRRRGDPASIDVRLQRSLTASVGVPLSAQIFPDGPTYSSGEQSLGWGGSFYCGPCRFVSVRPPLTNGGRVRLRWTGDIPLDLVAGEYYGDYLPLSAASSEPGALDVEVPSYVNVLLVGPGRQDGIERVVTHAIAFTLAIEAR